VICDDVADMREILIEALEDDPAIRVVGHTDNGDGVVRLVSELQPDVVVLDLSMPGMDGLEAIPLIAKACPSAGITIFSGFAAARIADTAFELGADRYVEKGRPLAALTATLHDVVRARRELLVPALVSSESQATSLGSGISARNEVPSSAGLASDN
jgi:hypothetical protein